MLCNWLEKLTLPFQAEQKQILCCQCYWIATLRPNLNRRNSEFAEVTRTTDIGLMRKLFDHVPRFHNKILKKPARKWKVLYGESGRARARST